MDVDAGRWKGDPSAILEHFHFDHGIGTALHYACHHGTSREVVASLLAHGAAPGLLNAFGVSPLLKAAVHGHVEMAHLVALALGDGARLEERRLADAARAPDATRVALRLAAAGVCDADDARRAEERTHTRGHGERALLRRARGRPDDVRRVDPDDTIMFASFATAALLPRGVDKGSRQHRPSVFYEVTLSYASEKSYGQIGWVAADAPGVAPHFVRRDTWMDEDAQEDVFGTGDTRLSWGLDGVRKKAFADGEELSEERASAQAAWKSGVTIGCAADLNNDHPAISFCVNGDWGEAFVMPLAPEMATEVLLRGGLLPAVSGYWGFVARFNFGGDRAWAFGPPDGTFSSVHDALVGEEGEDDTGEGPVATSPDLGELEGEWTVTHSTVEAVVGLVAVVAGLTVSWSDPQYPTEELIVNGAGIVFLNTQRLESADDSRVVWVQSDGAVAQWARGGAGGGGGLVT